MASSAVSFCVTSAYRHTIMEVIVMTSSSRGEEMYSRFDKNYIGTSA